MRLRSELSPPTLDGVCPPEQEAVTDTSGAVVCIGSWEPPPRVTPSPEQTTPASSQSSTTAEPTAPAVVEHQPRDDAPGIGSVLALLGPVLAIAVVVAALVALTLSLRRDGRAVLTDWWAAIRLGLRRALRLPRFLWQRANWRGRLLLIIAIITAVFCLAAWSKVPLLLQPLAVLALLGVLGGGLRLARAVPAVSAEPEPWWSERRLVGALRSAGVLPTPKPDDPPTVLRRHGAPRTDQHGTSVTFALPGARPWTEVSARRDRLAAALGVPARLLTVTHDADQAEGVVTLWVGVAQPRVVVASPVGAAPRTIWSEPVRIGRDAQGGPVALATEEANTLLAGQPGSGKTTTARTVLAHYLLDPATSVYLLDGKGSRADYGDARPLCARFVSGTEDDAVSATEQMLTEVLGIVRERNAGSGHGARPGGVLLLLEEFQDVRAAATKADREALDATLGRIVRMGRAVGVHVLVSTQRPSVDDLPSGVRNLIGQRVALMLRNAADAAIALGDTPSLPLPARRGEALLATPSGTVAVTLDHLDGDAWASVCRRAAAMRPRRPEPVPVAVRCHDEAVAEPEPTAPSEPVRDPLYAAVLAALADADPRGLPATALLALLPTWLAPANPAALGKALRGCPDLERGHVGKSPVWRLRRTLGGPSADPRSGPRSEGSEASDEASHARQRPSEERPSAASAGRP